MLVNNAEDLYSWHTWKRAREVEWTALEMRHTGNRIGGSPPSYDVAPCRMTGRIHQKSMYYTYILLLSNKDLYKGSTSDLKRRIEEHRRGEVASTRNHIPLNLIGYESYAVKSDAIRREKFLKTTEGMRLLRKQYRDTLKMFGAI